MANLLMNKKGQAAAVLVFCVLAGSLSGGDGADAAGQSGVGRSVLPAQVESAGKEVELLAAMGLPWEKPWLETREHMKTDPGSALEPVDYLLLRKEAQAKEVTISDATVQGLRAERGLTAQRLAVVADQAGVDPQACERALRGWLAIRRLAPGATRSLTDDQVQQLVRDLMLTTHVRFSILDSSLVTDSSMKPREEELHSFFLRYKDAFPSDESEGFGYRFAERVAFEIARTDLDADRDKITVTEADTRAAWGELRENELRTGQSMSKLPEDPTEEQVEAAYQRMLPDLVRAVRRRKGGARAKEIMDRLRTAYRQRAAQAGGEEAGLLKELAGQIEKESGLTIRYESMPLGTAADLARRWELGAYTRFNSKGRSIALTHLVFRVKGHYQPVHAEQAELPCELGKLVDATLRTYDAGQAHDALVYRVVDFRQEEAPQSLDQVRELVERDVRRARAYELTRRHADRLCQSAKTKGLAEAWSADPRVLRLYRADSVPFEPAPFTRARRLPPAAQLAVNRLFQPTEVDRVGRDLTFLTAVFKHAEAMGRLENPSQADRTTMFPLPMKHQWVVLEWLENKWLPGDREAVARMVKEQWGRLNAVQEQRAWFDPRAIRRRTGYVEPIGP